MARSLEFVYQGASFEATLIKIDRTQLYGSVRVLTRDADDRPCTMATLASDGKTLIPRGGTALGYVNTLGEWIGREQLQPVDPSGAPVVEVASSFEAPIELGDGNVATAIDVLDQSVRLSYRLDVDDVLPAPFRSALDAGGIFQFGFSYRGGVGHDPAFLMSDEQGVLWMLVTTPNAVDYVSLQQAALCSGEVLIDETENDDDDDDLDFGML